MVQLSYSEDTFKWSLMSSDIYMVKSMYIELLNENLFFLISTSKHARALLRVEQLNGHNCPSGTSGGDEREGQITRTFYDDVVSTER
jgi:hypothetical protein